MNHTITVAGLLLGFITFIGLIFLLIATSMIFSPGMSYESDPGRIWRRQGCRLGLFGLCLFVAGIGLLLLK